MFFSLINENHTGSLLFKIGVTQDINRISHEKNVFQNDRLAPLITQSAYKASHSLSDIGFEFDNASITASSTTGSALTYTQFVAQEIQEHYFYQGFYVAYGFGEKRLGIEIGSFEESKLIIDFHRKKAGAKLTSVRNLLSQSRDETPEDIPGFFHVVGGE